jgi:hypothetical protein
MHEMDNEDGEREAKRKGRNKRKRQRSEVAWRETILREESEHVWLTCMRDRSQWGIHMRYRSQTSAQCAGRAQATRQTQKYSIKNEETSSSTRTYMQRDTYTDTHAHIQHTCLILSVPCHRTQTNLHSTGLALLSRDRSGHPCSSRGPRAALCPHQPASHSQHEP